MMAKTVQERLCARTGAAFLVLIRDTKLADAIGVALRSRLSAGGKPAVVLTPPVSAADLLDPGACKRLRAWWDAQETGVELTDAVVVALDDEELSGLGRGAFLGVLPERDGIAGVRPHGNTVVDVPVGTVEELADAVAAYALAAQSPVFQVGAAVATEPSYEPIPVRPIAGRSKTKHRKLGFSPALLVTGTLVAGGWMLSAALGSSNANAATLPTHTHTVSHKQDVQQSLRQVGFAVNSLARHEAATHTVRHSVVRTPVRTVAVHASPALRHIPARHQIAVTPWHTVTPSRSQFRVLPVQSTATTHFPWSDELRTHLQPKVVSAPARTNVSAQLRQLAASSPSANPQNTLRQMSSALSALRAAPTTVSSGDGYSSSAEHTAPALTDYAPSTYADQGATDTSSSVDQGTPMDFSPASATMSGQGSSLSTPADYTPSESTSFTPMGINSGLNASPISLASQQESAPTDSADQSAMLTSAVLPDSQHSADGGFGCAGGSCFTPGIGDGTNDPTVPYVPTGPEYVNSLIPQSVKDAASSAMNFINNPDPANYLPQGQVAGITVGAGPVGLQVLRGTDAQGNPSTYVVPSIGSNLPGIQFNYGKAPQPGASATATGTLAYGPLGYSAGAGFAEPTNTGQDITSMKAGGKLFGQSVTNSQNLGDPNVSSSDALGVPTVTGSPKVTGNINDTIKFSNNGVEGLVDPLNPFPNFSSRVSAEGRQAFTNLIGQNNQDTINRELNPNDPNSLLSKAESLFPDAPNNGQGLIGGWLGTAPAGVDASSYDANGKPLAAGTPLNIPSDPSAVADGHGGGMDVAPSGPSLDAAGNPLPAGTPLNISGDQTAVADGFGGGIDVPDPQDLADLQAQQQQQDIGDLNTLSQDPGAIQGLSGMLGLSSSPDGNSDGGSLSPVLPSDSGPFSADDPMSALNGMPQSGGLFPGGLGDLGNAPASTAPAANPAPDTGFLSPSPNPAWVDVGNAIGPVINGFKDGKDLGGAIGNAVGVGESAGPIGGLGYAAWNGLTTVFPNIPTDISAAGRQAFTNIIGQDNQNAINQALDPNDPNSLLSKAEGLFPDAPNNGQGLLGGLFGGNPGGSVGVDPGNNPFSYDANGNPLPAGTPLNIPSDPSAVADGHGGGMDVAPSGPSLDAAGNPLPAGTPLNISGDQTAVADGFGGGIDVPDPQDLADLQAQQQQQDIGDLNTLSQDPGAIQGLSGMLGLSSSPDGNSDGGSLSPVLPSDSGPFSADDPMSALNGMPQSGGLFPGGLGDYVGSVDSAPDSGTFFGNNDNSTMDAIPGADGGMDGIPGLDDPSWGTGTSSDSSPDSVDSGTMFGGDGGVGSDSATEVPGGVDGIPGLGDSSWGSDGSDQYSNSDGSMDMAPSDYGSGDSSVDSGTALGDNGDTSSDSTSGVDGGIDGIPGLGDSSWGSGSDGSDSGSADSSGYSDGSDSGSGSVDSGSDGADVGDSLGYSDGSDSGSSDSSDQYSNSDGSMDMASSDSSSDGSDSGSADSSGYSDGSDSGSGSVDSGSDGADVGDSLGYSDGSDSGSSDSMDSGSDGSDSGSSDSMDSGSDGSDSSDSSMDSSDSSDSGSADSGSDDGSDSGGDSSGGDTSGD